MQLNGQRNGWGASAVDALSTALVMQIPEIVDEILDYIPTINFANTTTEVSLFETTVSWHPDAPVLLSVLLLTLRRFATSLG